MMMTEEPEGDRQVHLWSVCLSVCMYSTKLLPFVSQVLHRTLGGVKLRMTFFHSLLLALESRNCFLSYSHVLR